eukprot:UN03922
MISNGWTRKDGQSGCGKEGIEICKHTAKYVIDMLFDCDERKLQFGIVGHVQYGKKISLTDKLSHEITDIPYIDNGFVPHFIIKYVGTSLQIIRIEPSLFMIYDQQIQQLFDSE